MLREGWGVQVPMKKRETLKDKAYRLWHEAGLPEFLNKYGPKVTPAWKVFWCHLEYVEHAPNWRDAADFMIDYHKLNRHFTTWQKAISKWPQWVWDALGEVSVGEDECELAAVDGTSLSRTNASYHYVKRIDRKNIMKRPIQAVVMVDVLKRKFLSWRIRAKPRGEKCDVPYLINHSPTLPETLLMDKGFDSDPLHSWIRNQGVYSVAPVRKGCKRGRYRRQLRDCFDYGLYWQRNIVESLIGAVKRKYGSHIKSRKARMQRAEISIKLIAYNLRRALNLMTFY